MNQANVLIAEKAKQLSEELKYDAIKIIDHLTSTPQEEPELDQILNCASAISIFYSSILPLGVKEVDIKDAIDVWISCYVHDILKDSMSIATNTICSWIVHENKAALKELFTTQPEKQDTATTCPPELIKFHLFLNSLKQYEFSKKDLDRAEFVWMSCYLFGLSPDLCCNIALYWLKNKFTPDSPT